MMLLHEDFVPFRLLELVESFAVQVFDQLDLEHLAVIERADDGRNGIEARFAAGAPAPLARDDFECLRFLTSMLRPHDDGFDDLHRFDVLRQVLERRQVVMRSPALLNRRRRGFDAFQCEISDRERDGCGTGMIADVGIHANVL